MRPVLELRRACVLGAVVAASLTVGVGAAAAESPTWLCVPEATGKTVTSGGSEGKCETKNTAVELPPPAEMTTLNKILPDIQYVASGIGGKPTIQFSAINVQIINGSGKTASVNGEGNLVIGYDENTAKHEQTGSHNLILGEGQTFTSYGGILAGESNSITAPFSSVTGGSGNTASGEWASVSGGREDKATGKRASVSGGAFNEVSGEYASVSGGASNKASAAGVSISGGSENAANSLNASVSGGHVNTASGEWASVSGGVQNTASGEDASVSGGQKNTAKELEASVGGGFKNLAEGRYSSIFGGKELTATKEYEAIP